MSRVTPPKTKFLLALHRSISSSAQAARPTALLDSSTRSAVYLPRRLADLKAECSKRNLKTSGGKAELVDRLTAHDLTREHSTLGGHRPSSVTQAVRKVPLMQGFRTSAPKPAAHDNSTIDFMFFPEIEPAAPINPFQKLRVPLLPDNYNPDRSPNSGHEIETLDGAVDKPEILIVASHPEDVVPAAMTEVVGNDALESGIEELTTMIKDATPKIVKEPGVIKELWSGLLDDVLGAKNKKIAI